jgi:hypothetical protein
VLPCTSLLCLKICIHFELGVKTTRLILLVYASEKDTSIYVS